MTVSDPPAAGANGSSTGPGIHPGASDQAESEPLESLEALAGVAGSAVGPLLAAFEEAGPEAAEHLVNAAHEFSLAVKVVVDALERGLASQREALASEAASPPSVPAAPSGRSTSGVHRIDVE